MPRNLAIAPLVVWLISLVTPVAATAAKPHEFGMGWMILLSGWAGVFMLQFGWFGNVLLLIATARLITRRKQSAVDVVLSSLLIISATDALFWGSMNSGRGMYGEGADITDPQSFGIGYFLWLLAIYSSATLLLARPHAKPAVAHVKRFDGL